MDDDTFDDYVRTRGNALLRFGYVLTGDRHLAEDLVQDSLARCHRRWRRIVLDGSPEAYVRKAVVRAYLSWRRRRASTETVVADVPDRPVDGLDLPTRLSARDEMWALLAKLPKAQRAVLVLRFYEDLPDVDIAALLGCAPVTVRVHAARGLARLRSLVPAAAGGTS